MKLSNKSFLTITLTLCTLFGITTTQAATLDPAIVWNDIDSNEKIVRDYIYTQLLITAKRLSKGLRGQDNKELQIVRGTNINTFSTDEKVEMFRELSYETKTFLLEAVIFNFLNSKNPKPFKIPAECPQVSQMDMFCLTLCAFIENIEIDVPEQVTQDVLELFASCVGDKGVFSIRAKLNKLDEYPYNQVVPTVVQEKFVTTDPLKLNKLRLTIEKRVEL